MSGFGLVSAATGAPTTASTARVDAGSGTAGTDATATQFAAMLVALLGGGDPPSAMQPIARPDETPTIDTPSEGEGEDAAATLRYGILVDGPQSAVVPPLLEVYLPIDFPPLDVQAPIAGAPPARAAVGEPSRDLERLTPEFRSRLERVMVRMREEHGHDVQLVETARSPERQAWLFAQGRTRPGQVVTWTHQSAHLTGDAADVIVDGQWRGDRAYGRLHRIAEEEGLRTLGARDPGHLELPAAVRSARVQLAGGDAAANAVGASAEASQQQAALLAHNAVARASARSRRAGRNGESASTNVAAMNAAADGASVGLAPDAPDGMARIASAASVARVASIASVASTARPGASSASATGERLSSDLTLAHGGRSRRRTDAEAHDAMPTVAPIATFTAGSTGDMERTSPSLVGGIDRVDRTAAIAGKSPREVAQLTLALDAGNGQQDDVTIGVRGQSVGASVSTGDASMAARLRDNLPELQRALEARGMGIDEFRADARRPELSDPSRVLAAGDRDAIRVRTMQDAGDSALSRDGQDGQRSSPDERRASRDPRQQGEGQHPFNEQDQRERQGAARDHASRLAAFRRAGRPTYGENVA